MIGTLIALVAFVAIVAPAAGEPLTFDRLASLVVPTDAAVSPDGRRVAYTLAVPEADAWRVELRVVATDGTGDRRLADGGAPSWSPDGRLLAYAARDASGRQIWLLDPDGGTPRRLTEAAGGVVEWRWSPTGDRIAYAAPLPGEEASTEGPRLYRPDAAAALALHVVSLSGGAPRQLTASRSLYASPFGGGGSFDWSPDGAEIALALQPSRAVEAAYEADLFLVSVGEGSVRPLLERPGLDIRPVFSPDGGRIAFVTSFGARDRFATHGLAVLRLGDAEVLDVGRAVDAAFLDAPQGYVWTADGKALLTEAARGLTRVLLRLDASTGAVREETDRARFRTGLGFSADRRYTAYLSSTPREPYDVWLLDRASGVERRLTDLNPDARGWRLPEWEVVSWRNGEGDLLEGLLARPGQPETDLPALVWLHGGPEGHAVAAFDPTVPLVLPAFDPHPLQLLATRGYAVFLPNFRGSAGYGADFRQAVRGRPAETLRDDVLSGVDELARRGVVDPARLAVAGWASGGTRVGELIGLTGRFRAAIAGAANFDLRSAYGDGDFTVQWHSLMGAAPWEAPAAWDASSPVRNAARVSTPTLLLHGEADPLVPVRQAVEYHNYLRWNGVPGELWLYPDEGHGIARRSSRSHAARTILAWLERWLR